MKTLIILTRRNVKMFFNEKGLFFTSLITPAILLILYATFLGDVYKDAFLLSLGNFTLPERVINGYVAAQLMSSILAVSCVTVSFSSNMLMVQDKANGTVKDMLISPLKQSTLSLSYYFATLFSTLMVCIFAAAICFAYCAVAGWYMSFADVIFIIFDVVLAVMFGTALSSVVNFFLSSSGQISAVGTLVSSTYGFVCGAYMPISQFSEGLQKVISFLPGTYVTSLFRNHAMSGVIKQMELNNIPHEIVNALRDAMDCNIYFFGNNVGIGVMYAIVFVTVAILITIYCLENVLKGKKAKR